MNSQINCFFNSRKSVCQISANINKIDNHAILKVNELFNLLIIYF